MKVYRRSFWKTVIGLPFAIAFSLQFVIAPDVISRATSNLGLGIAIALVINLCMFSAVFFSEFYIILFGDALSVKNAMYPFWKKKVYYKDIMKIIIVYNGGRSVPYMQVITGKTRFAWRYYLDRVRSKDFLEIIASLRENDVKVDVIGMDFRSDF